MTGNLKALLDGPFTDKELTIVTNRQPYVYKKTHSGIKEERTAGGLATALDDVPGPLISTLLISISLLFSNPIASLP